MRIALFIVAALIAAGGTGYYLFQELAVSSRTADPAVAEVETPKSREVFVPAAPMAAGAIITHDKLSRMRIDDTMVTPQMIVADEAGLEFLIGGVARQSLPDGVPIARAAIVQPGDRGFLAAVLPKGKRAISIQITETGGLSGLVQPGDRVDIILTYRVSAEMGDFERDIRASETVIENIRVLALDQRLQSTQPIKNKDGEIVPPPIAQTATLEVSPRQAEMITLATTLGELSMVLNSVRDGGDPDAEAPFGNSALGSGLVAGGLGEFLGPMLRSGPAGGPVAPASLTTGADIGHGLTLDTDVTSLLQRLIEDAKDKRIDMVPSAKNRSPVQIVRGNATAAVQIGRSDAAEATLAPGEAAEAD